MTPLCSGVTPLLVLSITVARGLPHFTLAVVSRSPAPRCMHTVRGCCGLPLKKAELHKADMAISPAVIEGASCRRGCWRDQGEPSGLGHVR